MRKKRAPKREIKLDPKYKSKLVTQLINKIMLDGKRSAAQKIVYGALEIAEQELNKPPLEVLDKVLENVKPMVEVRARRVGGASYQVPVEIRPERRLSLALRWIVTFARKRHEKSMTRKLASEFIDAFNNQGGSIKKKEDMHRMAEANRAFAHYKW